MLMLLLLLLLRSSSRDQIEKLGFIGVSVTSSPRSVMMLLSKGGFSGGDGVGGVPGAVSPQKAILLLNFLQLLAIYSSHEFLYRFLRSNTRRFFTRRQSGAFFVHPALNFGRRSVSFAFPAASVGRRRR